MLGLTAAVGVVAWQGTSADPASKPRVVSLDAASVPKLTFHRVHVAESAPSPENQPADQGAESEPGGSPVQQPISEGSAGEGEAGGSGAGGGSGSSEKPPGEPGGVIEGGTR